MLQRITSLFRNLLIYGLGDVFTSVVSLLLLPIFTNYLTPTDYGVITMLATIEAVTKVTFRWGVDTAFMRMYYDCADQAARQRLASTIFFFLLAVNGSLVLAGVLSAGWLSARLIDSGAPSEGVLVALTIANTFVSGFYFIPYHVLRIAEKSKQYIALTFTRTASTIVARLLLVVWLKQGVFGIVLADIVVTTGFTLIMSRWYLPLIRPVFSWPILKDALGFGLPRVPHSVAQQVISVADRYFLKAYGALSDVGLYSMGATFGLALKYFLSAFESAWTPFFLGAMKESNPGRIYSAVSTYVVAVLVLLVSGLCALAPDVVALFTKPGFQASAAVTPWIALGVMFQGLYLVGSIGLVITKRTTLYPIATGIAAVVSVVANRLLIPHHGMLGAAWANVIAYATLAAVTSFFSWRVFPIRYEWSRLARIALAGALGYTAAIRLVPAMRPILELFARGLVVVAVYALVLTVTGFFHVGELRLLRDVRRRIAPRKSVPTVVPSQTDVEMAGEIVGSVPEVEETTAEPSRDRPTTISRDSRSPRR